MESIKEIRTHIDSVQQTLKITNAMYLISSSKLRKARQQLTNIQPYFTKTKQTISDILHRTQDVEHVYFDRRPDKHHKVGYIIITGDKGLAGAYNHNVLRMAEEHMKQFDDTTLFLIGQVGRSYFRHKGVEIAVEFMYTAQDPTAYRAREIAETFVEHVPQGPAGRGVRGLHRDGHPHDAGTQDPQAAAAGPGRLPLAAPPPRRTAACVREVTYMPSPAQVLNHIVPGYLKGLLLGTLVESFCSEQNARMMAMDTATDNARELLKTLQLEYNRARQTAITQEITEIVAGAQGGGEDDWDDGDDWADAE